MSNIGDTPVIFHDDTGQLRRLVLPTPDPARVMAVTPHAFADKFPVWSSEQIRIALQDPGRKCGRNLFSAKCIQNQGPYGSCAGYAGAQIVAKNHSLRDPVNAGDGNYIKLSGAYVYSRVNGGRDNGSMLEDVFEEIQNGVPPEAMVPYDQIYPNRQLPSAKTEAAKIKGHAGYRINSWEELCTAAAMGGLLATCVQAGTNYQRLDSNGVAGVDASSGNHANHADDARWRNGSVELDNVNQWGVGYGDNGRAWMGYASYKTPMKYHQFYAFFSTEETP